MQLGVDVTCMHTSFGGRDPSDFGDIATFQKRLKKFMQLGVDVTCMHISFGGRDPSSFGDMATFQKQPNSLLGHGL